MAIPTYSAQYVPVVLPSPEPLSLLSPSRNIATQGQGGGSKSESKDRQEYGKMTQGNLLVYSSIIRNIENEYQQAKSDIISEAKKYDGSLMDYMREGGGMKKLMEARTRYENGMLQVESLKPDLEEHFNQLNDYTTKLRDRGITDESTYYNDLGEPVNTVGNVLNAARMQPTIYQDKEGNLHANASLDLTVVDFERYNKLLSTYLNEVKENIGTHVVETNSLGIDKNGLPYQHTFTQTYYGPYSKGKALGQENIYTNSQQIRTAYNKFIEAIQSSGDAELAKTHQVILNRHLSDPTNKLRYTQIREAVAKQNKGLVGEELKAAQDAAVNEQIAMDMFRKQAGDELQMGYSTKEKRDYLSERLDKMLGPDEELSPPNALSALLTADQRVYGPPESWEMARVDDLGESWDLIVYLHNINPNSNEYEHYEEIGEQFKAFAIDAIQNGGHAMLPAEMVEKGINFEYGKIFNRAVGKIAQDLNDMGGLLPRLKTVIAANLINSMSGWVKGQVVKYDKMGQPVREVDHALLQTKILNKEGWVFNSEDGSYTVLKFDESNRLSEEGSIGFLNKGINKFSDAIDWTFSTTKSEGEQIIITAQQVSQMVKDGELPSYDSEEWQEPGLEVRTKARDAIMLPVFPVNTITAQSMSSLYYQDVKKIGQGKIYGTNIDFRSIPTKEDDEGQMIVIDIDWYYPAYYWTTENSSGGIDKKPKTVVDAIITVPKEKIEYIKVKVGNEIETLDDWRENKRLTYGIRKVKAKDIQGWENKFSQSDMKYYGYAENDDVYLVPIKLLYNLAGQDAFFKNQNIDFDENVLPYFVQQAEKSRNTMGLTMGNAAYEFNRSTTGQ